MTDCEKFYKTTKTEIEIILSDRPFLRSETQRWQSKDLILTWDVNHLEQYIYSVYSPHIENLSDSNHIMNRVMSLMLLYNGAQYITCLHLNDKVEATAIEGKGFSEKLWATEIDEYPFEHNEEFYDINCFQYKNASLDIVLFELAKIDPIIRVLLFLAGLIKRPNTFEDNILNWGTLYKIYDTVNYGSKKVKIDIDTLISKKDIKAFTATCNNMSILGLNSRHGLKDYGKTPENIIEEQEKAVYIILCLSKNFLIEYIKLAHNITYRGKGCRVEDYTGRVFQPFSEADIEEFRNADFSKYYQDE